MMPVDDNTVNIKMPPAKKSYHHGDLRDGLVAAGMRLLEDRNSDDLALREVAREVGVSATAVYRHFPDKSALLQAIAQRGFDMMGTMQEQAAQDLAGPAAFAAVGGAYVRFALHHPAVFRLMFSCVPPVDLFSVPLAELSGPLLLLRAHVAALTPAAMSERAKKIVSIRAWALVHGLAVLALDRMIAVDDAMIDAVIMGDTCP